MALTPSTGSDAGYAVDIEPPVDAARLQRRIGFALGGIGAELADAEFRGRRIGRGPDLFRFEVRLSLHDGRRIEVQDTQANLELAAERALSRAVRAVQRALKPVRAGAPP